MQHLRGCLPGRRKRHFQELLEVGWLEVSADGSISVHDWDDWQSNPPEDPTRKKRQTDYRETHREELAEKERVRRGDVATMRGDGMATPRGDVQTETETETEKKRRERKKTLSPMVPSLNFLTFWRNYPRKVGKQAALQAWKRHKPILDQCLAALTWQRESEDWQKDAGAFVPYPATWINQHRWEDEPRVLTGPIAKPKGQDSIDNVFRRLADAKDGR